MHPVISPAFHCDPRFAAISFPPPIVHIASPCSAPLLRTNRPGDHRHDARLTNQVWKTRILWSSSWTKTTARGTHSLLSMTVMVVRGVSCFVITCRLLHLKITDPPMQIGASVAKYAGTNVFKRLAGEQGYKDGNYQDGLKKAFLGTDEDILKSDRPIWPWFPLANGTS